MQHHHHHNKHHRKLGESEDGEDDDEDDEDDDEEEDAVKSHYSPADETEEDEESDPSEEQEDNMLKNGPLIDSEIMPNKLMLDAANPYLNPMHPLHPFKHEFNVQHHFMTPHGMITHTNSSGNGKSSGGGGDNDFGHGGDDDFGHGGYNGLGDYSGIANNMGNIQQLDHIMGMPGVTNEDKCDTVHRRAMKIASKLLKKQNKMIFEKLMGYLLKSKFLVGMTEIKLNRIMRKKIFNVMRSYSKLSRSNLEFVTVPNEPELSDDDESEEESGVQNFDFSEYSNPEHPHGSAGEMGNMVSNEMNELANPHLNN